MITITGFPSDPRAGPPEPTSRVQTRSAEASRVADQAELSVIDRIAAAKEVVVELPEISAGKLHLALDEKTGRVVGKVIDRESGELLWQVPSDEMLRLIAATEELLGPLFSTEA